MFGHGNDENILKNIGSSFRGMKKDSQYRKDTI
jgi:hypothetical protein